MFETVLDIVVQYGGPNLELLYDNLACVTLSKYIHSASDTHIITHRLCSATSTLTPLPVYGTNVAEETRSMASQKMGRIDKMGVQHKGAGLIKWWCSKIYGTQN